VQALCGLTDLTDLDLDRNKIGVDGAKSLSALTDLTGLWLGSNGIGDGGVRALCRLTNLTVLDLRFNKIGVDAVKSLSSLTGLTALGLWGNEIGDEGAEALRPLTNLTELYLGYNQIGVKGAQALCGLTGLTILNLDDNEIEVDGAKSLSSLTGLTKLWLGDNEVGDEGAQALSALINLTELYLSNAQISSKGARALRKLSRLTILDLDGNKIGKLGAKSLSSLIGLTKLRLAENGISDEGARALGKLTNLTELFLQNNDIENDGAVAIGALTNLNVLDLEGNEIGSEGAKALLDALAFASPPSRLKTLELTDGVASSVSLTPELLRSGEAQAIFAAYRAAREAAKTSTSAQWNTAKLLVVGDETAGKTSLIKFLVHNEPRDPNQTKTSGIDLRERVDITRWAQGGTDITLNIWDFAGQVRTHGTHRFFFSERCLYLLVLQDRLEDDRSIDYWLKAILNRAGNAPILVVINKSDQGKNNLRLDEARYQRECSNIIGFLRTSCNDDPWARNSIASLRSVIGRTMTHPQLTHVRDPIPRHWLRVRDQLAQRTSAERVITISEFRNLCRSAASTMENPSDELFSEAGQRALLIQLHYIGVVVAYGIDASAPAATREITLLDPNWLITAVYSVLEQPALRDQNGRFWRTDLEKWLNPMEYPKDRHEFIVSQMLTEDVHLCFRLPEEKDAYLVPAALPATAPDYGKWPEFSWSSAALRFRYRYSLLPNDLITRFLVEAHRRLTDQPTLWATGAVLQAAECRILVTADLDRRCIDVLVDAKGKSQNRRRDALNRLQDDFETVHNFYKQNAPDARVPLPDDPGLDEQYEHLLNLEQRMGRDYEHWPSGAKRSYKVCELLDGVRREDYSGSFEKQIAAMRSVPARGQPMARRDKVDQTSPGLLVGQRAQPRRRIAKPPAPRTTTPPVDLLLVTVNPHETKQLIKAFEEGTGSKAQPVQKNRRLYRDLGTINGTRVFHALSGMGSAGPGGTQQTVDKAIRALRPQAVICVGIAFGINDKNQSIGDILIAKQLRLYDLQRIGKRIMLRGEKPSASTWLINVFESIAQTSWEGAPVLSGVMLTGQKLVDNFNYRKQLLGFEPEAIGGEMEGAGVYVACDDMKIDWIVVKAICDWGDGTKSKNKASRQRRAARNAADFLMHALKYAPLTLGNRRRRQPA
jgi:small GTP-binding protein